MMMSDRYILDGKTPVECDDLITWAAWMETGNRVVNKTVGTVSVAGKNVGEIKISTVFLGLDHSFGKGEPLLFETMVFGGPLDQRQDRCSTWEAAEKMHDLWCSKVQLATKDL